MSESSTEIAIEIAGNLTAADWLKDRASLVVGGDGAQWQVVFDSYLKQRLELRYLKPIRTLRDSDTFLGEGFTICAIQCTLIEFLAATNGGMNYRHKGAVPPFEYSQSGPLFKQFLETQAPFESHFDGKAADDFYTKIRCGLLHEAATKDSWRIRARSSDGTVIDLGRKIVFRNNLQTLIETFIDRFRERIATEVSLQNAFLRKFDDLSKS